MSTNVFFNNFSSSGEQNLIEDLIIESIKIYGQDVWFIRRTLGAVDDVLNEDDLPEFSAAHEIETYIKNVEGFEGEGDLLQQFGVEIRDQMTLTLSMRRFDIETSYTRPNEGDLIYFPLVNKIFVIMHVEHEAIYYQMGSLQTWDLKCELFEYSGERFTTGVAEVDSLFTSIDPTTNSAISDVSTVDVFADNIDLEDAADDLIDFSEADPWSEGGRW